MEFWVKKVALITDCGDEYGMHIAEKLKKCGMTVIGIVKNDKETNILEEQIIDRQGIVIFKCCNINIDKFNEIFEKINHTYKGIDVIINNSYCNINTKVSDGKLTEIKKIIDLNIKLNVAATRLAARSMFERKSRGIILFIDKFKHSNKKETKGVFITTKAAIDAVNEILRVELKHLNVNIKVTNILSQANYDRQNIATKEVDVEDVAAMVVKVLEAPENLHIHEIWLEKSESC